MNYTTTADFQNAANRVRDILDARDKWELTDEGSFEEIRPGGAVDPDASVTDLDTARELLLDWRMRVGMVTHKKGLPVLPLVYGALVFMHGEVWEYASIHNWELRPVDGGAMVLDDDEMSRQKFTFSPADVLPRSEWLGRVLAQDEYESEIR